MRCLTIAAKNLRRRPVRSLLTAAGLAVAVAAIVALVGVAESFESSFLSLYTQRGADLVVQRRGGAVQLSKGCLAEIRPTDSDSARRGAGHRRADGHGCFRGPRPVHGHRQRLAARVPGARSGQDQRRTPAPSGRQKLRHAREDSGGQSRQEGGRHRRSLRPAVSRRRCLREF